MMHINRKPKNQNSETLSLKPIAIGGFLIVVVVIFYFSKTFIVDKNKQEALVETNQKKSENISVPMILPEDLQLLIYRKNHQLIDIRSATEFEIRHIENSKNMPLQSLKDRANILDKNIPVIIIDQVETREGKEAVQYLNKIGFSVKYLVGGINNFSEKGYSVISYGDPNSILDIAKVNPISPKEAQEKFIDEFGSIKFLDVRPRIQFEKYHIEGAINIPLEELEQRKSDIPISKMIVVDEDTVRSFQASVRLSDMNFIGVYCLTSSLEEFKNLIKGEGNASDSEKNENPEADKN